MTVRYEGIKQFFEALRLHPVLSEAKLLEEFLSDWKNTFDWEKHLPLAQMGTGNEFNRDFMFVQEHNFYEAKPSDSSSIMGKVQALSFAMKDKIVGTVED